MDRSPADSAPARRDFLASLAALSAVASGAALPLARAAGAPDAAPHIGSAGALDAECIAAAERLAGISFTPQERAQIVRTIGEQLSLLSARAEWRPLPNALAPAQVFSVLLPGEPAPSRHDPAGSGAAGRAADSAAAPSSAPAPAGGAAHAQDLDFATLAQLGAWLRSGAVTSRQLVDRSLGRLRAANPTLHCAITIVEAQARAEADARDAEARAGRWRGPLHGIPYGLKDILDTAGIATTWGAEPWRERIPDTDSIVAARLREAGAVLVAKTAVGALAYGDIWFGGTCRNPWRPAQGSSGSSAGSASAVAAGCVPFAIGSETLGSIVSPCERCGTTGLRPTFGRVSREGCMALCWSWDKIGPIARCVADVATVLAAINGASLGDPSSVDAALDIPAAAADPRGRRVVTDPAWAEGESAGMLQRARTALREAGIAVDERRIEPPADPSVLMASLLAEAAAAFESLTRDGLDDQLSWQADEAWPNTFRRTWFLPAIELVQVERVRRRCMEWMRTALGGADAILCPPFAGGMLMVTNATGHPCLVQRAGFPEPDRPSTLTLIGRPFDEATLASIGIALERGLGVSATPPPLDWLKA